jgi:formylglycine-generating enzyme required for sulfatase activity
MKLPPKCEAAAGAEIVTLEGKKYYSKIVYKLDDGTEIPLLLIDNRRASDPPTFYMMENKVSVQQFKEFASVHPPSDSRWREGALAAGTKQGIDNENLPVMNVSVIDSLNFARWMGGKLPSTEQWNKAAGLYEPDRDDGPYQPPWDKGDKTQIAVNRGKEGPLEVGTATKDISPFHCRDMAGNGREWTRDVTGSLRNKQVTPDYVPDEFDGVVLRGRSYIQPTPLQYADLEKARSTEAQNYKEVSPQTGFRVVIEPTP